MDYVEHINIFGADVKQNPCIKGEGAPTMETVGDIGFFYMNTLNGDTYKCIAVSEVGTYTWVPNNPLHYNYIVTLSVAFEDLFRQGGVEGNPYTNSFRTIDFSRTPKVGDIFSLIFIDKNQNNVYSFAEIVGEPVLSTNGNWYSAFKMVYAIMLHNTAEIANLKEAVNDLETEEWTFLVENADGTTTPTTKKVCIKQ